MVLEEEEEALVELHKAPVRGFRKYASQNIVEFCAIRVYIMCCFVCVRYLGFFFWLELYECFFPV